MSKRKTRRATAERYHVLTGISHKGTGERHEPGAVVALGEEWDIDGFLAINAIEPALEAIEFITEPDGEEAEPDD